MATTATRRRKKSAWASEGEDLVRGACGGFLFGIPLLYTMEVWWIGSFTNPPMMMVAIAASFIVIFLLNRTAGFRKTQDIRGSDALVDTIEATAIGLVCATLMLILLRQLTPNVPLDEALGKVLFEGAPFALGVALANQFLGGADDSSGQSSGSEKGRSRQEAQMNATLADVGATLIGAAVIAFSIAPTDEVAMIAASVAGGWLLAMIAASVLISYGIVFAAGFTEQQKRVQQRGIFQRPPSETVMSYLVSLLAAAFMLWFFQQLSFDDPWTMWLQYTLVLGLPATIGGAAGRLAL